MSKVLQFPPRLRTVKPEPTPDRPPASVHVLAFRCMPATQCTTCQLRLPADHTHLDEPTPA